MRVHELLETTATDHPDRVLLVCGSERSTYGEIDARATALARGLIGLGVAPGDRVGLLSRNTPFYVAAYYGILKAGGIVVSLNTAADAGLVTQLLDDCEATALLASDGFAPVVADAAPRVKTLSRVIFEDTGDLAGSSPALAVHSARDLDPDPGADIGVSIAIDDPAAIVYTSGSTGRPRGATLSHRNLVANTRSIVSYLGLGPHDSVLDILPFHYVYGKSLLNTHVAVGGSLVIEESLLFPDVVLDRMIEESVTGLSGVPSTFAILLNRSTLLDREFPALRYVTQAGGAMPVEHIRRLMDALPGKRIFIMYGATEASARLSYLPPQDLEQKMGSIGKAIPGVELDLVTEDGTLAGPDEVGEIVARGENIMLGYWNDAPETEAVLGPHGLRTGDLGRRDADGYFYVVGRKRDMIKAGANRISAREIEEAMVEHDGVEEAAVIGVADEFLGEAIHAFVTLKPDVDTTVEDLREFARTRLPAFKVPKEIRIRAELPRLGSGKISKEALRGEAG